MKNMTWSWINATLGAASLFVLCRYNRLDWINTGLVMCSTGFFWNALIYQVNILISK